MKRRSSMEAPSKHDHNAGLNPTLGAALGSLEVQLEDELARYRRHRQGRLTRPARQLSFNTNPKPRSLDLIAIKPNGVSVGGATPSTGQASTVSPFPVPVASPAAPQAAPSGVQAAPPPAPEAVQAPLTPPAAPTEPAQPLPAPDPQSSSLARWEPPAETDALAEMEPASTDPQDYLESSEHLLQSLSEDETEPSGDRTGLMINLMTPLGLGSLLLLLVASIALGYVITNPAALSHLRLNRLWNGESQPAGGETGDPASSAPGLSSQVPTSPNLASQEFVDLDLGTLSTLPGTRPAPSASPSPTPGATQPNASQPSPSPSPAPTASPQATAAAPGSSVPTARTVAPTPVVPPQPARLQQSAPQPAPEPEPEPEPPVEYSAPEPPEPPAPSSTAARPEAQAPTPASEEYYYVVTDYSGDQSLESVRDVVDDAYVRNFEAGAQIQVGAFTDEAGARELVENLQQQGISAEVQTR